MVGTNEPYQGPGPMLMWNLIPCLWDLPAYPYMGPGPIRSHGTWPYTILYDPWGLTPHWHGPRYGTWPYVVLDGDTGSQKK